MKYARLALMAAAAACLLPFATPALAELGHPSGCARCGGAYDTPSGHFGYEGIPVVGLNESIPPATPAIASPGPAPVSNCTATLYGARHEFYLTMCTLG